MDPFEKESQAFKVLLRISADSPKPIPTLKGRPAPTSPREAGFAWRTPRMTREQQGLKLLWLTHTEPGPEPD